MPDATFEDWQVVVEHWRGQGRDVKYIAVPAEFAERLGVPLEAARCSKPQEEDEDEMATRKAAASKTGGEPEALVWKKRSTFDGTTCGIKDCSRGADGYIQGTRSTREGKNGRAWWGPACRKCATLGGVSPLSIQELFVHQQRDVSGLSIALDLEVGETLRRLEAGSVSMNSHAGTPEASHTQSEVVQQVPSGAISALAKEETFSIAVVVPYDALEKADNEIRNTLSALDGTANNPPTPFLVRSQAQMDYASQYAAYVLQVHAALDKQCKALSEPFKRKVKEIQDPFAPRLKGLMALVARLKEIMLEGDAWARQQQQASLQQAQQALATGNMQGVAVATQQAASADVNLSQGVSARKKLVWRIVDPSRVPAALWSIDPAKVDAAIEAGHRHIDGLEIVEETVGLTVRQNAGQMR